MNPQGPSSTPAILRCAQTAVDAICEARAMDSEIALNVEKTADLIKRRGELLARAKESVGHGEWLQFLEKTWPGLHPRTAQRWMSLAKCDTVSHLSQSLRDLTDPADDAERSDGSREPATPDGTGESGAGIAGERVQVEVEADTPLVVDGESSISAIASSPPRPVCDRCLRVNGGRSVAGCGACAELQADNQKKRSAGGKPVAEGSTKQVSSQSVGAPGSRASRFPQPERDQHATSRKRLEKKVRATMGKEADQVAALHLELKQALACDTEAGNSLRLLASEAGVPIARRPADQEAAAGFEDRAEHQHKEFWPTLEIVEDLLRKVAEGKSD